MKLKLSVAILLLLIVQSCCLNKGEEINRVVFSVEEKATIPYADDQTVDMITDEGFQFQLNATTTSSIGSDQEHCEDYTSYENYKATLTSDLPNLNIELRLRRRYNEIDDIQFLDVRVIVNRLYFYYDEEQPLGTIEINGTTYTDVYRYTTGIMDEPISEVFYNEVNGILRINYLNGDYAQIN